MPRPRHLERTSELRATPPAAPPDGYVDTWQDELLLVGGGFAGRCVPERDTTRDELAAGGNYDNEGRNGGWVLPLLPPERRGVRSVAPRVANRAPAVPLAVAPPRRLLNHRPHGRGVRLAPTPSPSRA